MRLHIDEIRVIDSMELGSEPIIFDVGAHHGDFALYAIEKWPDAKITCFEPHPKSLRKLWSEVSDFARIEPVALSDELGDSKLYGNGLTASMFGRDFSYMGITDFNDGEITVVTDRLDNYIEHSIDYLKIDVEGNEFKVLLGAGKYLDPVYIKNIQFEFNSCNLDSRTFFRDFWNLLRPKGYQLYHDGNLIENYSTQLEDFTSSKEIVVK